jgi:hypothetical protein
MKGYRYIKFYRPTELYWYLSVAVDMCLTSHATKDYDDDDDDEYYYYSNYYYYYGYYYYYY